MRGSWTTDMATISSSVEQWGGSRRNSEEREQELSFRHLRLRCQSDFQLEKCGKQTGLQIRQKVWAEL